MQAGGSKVNRQVSTASQYLNKIVLCTLLCFALAGLITGFAIGGFTGHNRLSSTTGPIAPQINTPSIAQHTPDITVTSTQENIQPGNPFIGRNDYSSVQTADGTTGYTFSAQIVDKNTNQPIQENDVTCRLWLTQDTNSTQLALSRNNYALPKAIASLSQPFPAEEAGALNFTASSQQVQPCAANGKTTWTYILSPELNQGTYFLVVLADWKGIHYNWYLVQITINQPQENNEENNGAN